MAEQDPTTVEEAHALDGLVEAERQLEARLAEARAEAQQRIEAARAAAGERVAAEKRRLAADAAAHLAAGQAAIEAELA